MGAKLFDYAVRTTLVAAALASAPASMARASARFQFDLPAQALGASLRAVAAVAQLDLVAPAAAVDARPAAALAGRHSVEEAVALLLRGSGLRAERVGATIVVRADTTEGETAKGPAGPAEEVLITGSRIRGAPIASTLITRDQTQIRNSGRTDLGQVVRDIPQNFGGGQNPGIGANVPEASGVDVGGGSSLNLRGLGSDATLTLLNGHRLTYSAVSQSIDLTIIPLAMVDRIELVPDGASALYGSDAVAGVANVILKRDYDGIEAGALLGKATGGGDFQQQYSLMAGKRWSGGGVVGAYEYGRSTEINADQRGYGADFPGLTLFPRNAHHSFAASGHQALTATVSGSVDSFYNERRSGTFFPTFLGTDPSGARGHYFTTDRAFAVAPELELRLPSDWRLALAGSVGREKVDYAQTVCSGSCATSGSGYYRNTERAVDLSGDGDLLTLPGGMVKLALGTGYRRIGFERYNGSDSTLNTQRTQANYYAYGELSLPLIGEANAAPWLQRLTATAAVRYERYPGIDHVATPKLGLVLAPSRAVDLKASWGKSFRAPTLYQQYQPRSVYLFPPAFVGGSGFPLSATTLVVLGGNPDLKPERATTWSAGAELHPGGIPGLDLGASYFDVHYRDRIVTPIQSLSAALTDPRAGGQVILAPSQAQIDASIASGIFTNYTGQPYDPADVVAIVDNASVNAGRFTARGIDLNVAYLAPVGRGQLRLGSDLSYLTSRRQLTASQPVTALAGTIFNPPHVRGHATAAWSQGLMTLTGDASHSGGVRDRRFASATRVQSMTTFDLTARFLFDGGPALVRGLDLTLSVQNLFDAKPDRIQTTYPFDTPYDSTNYSPIGRFVSVGVRKTW